MITGKSSIRLYASAAKVITQFLQLPGKDRVKNIIERITKLSDRQTGEELQQLLIDFETRHRNIFSIFQSHFHTIASQYDGDISGFSNERKLLTGAYFTKEYSIQASALFNPSIVSFPATQDLSAASQKFIMSLRATGEGHISSIVFKTGTITDDLGITLDHDAPFCTPLQKNTNAIYTKEFIVRRLAISEDPGNAELAYLPEKFTASAALEQLKNNNHSNRLTDNLKEIFDSNYDLESPAGLSINEKVIFPNSRTESMGMEDVRFVKFTEDNISLYYGTYTAYDGKHIRTKLIETADFDSFKIRTLYGDAISDKGMALFPEKINGRYVMIARQGGESMNIMFSDDLYFWNNYDTLLMPEYDWELVQIGNCGSPVKTDKGWLLLTHGVGIMRTYVISAILLDLNEPSKIIARLAKPLIKAGADEREGYVPNVVYTCGLLAHKNLLLIPYAMSDAATGFITVNINDLINEMI